jgi:hypothetical protein
MSHTVPGIRTRLKYMGIFHIQALYRTLIEFLKDERYCDEQTYKYMETYYHEKRSSDPREAKSMWIWWRMGKPEEDVAPEHAYYWFDLGITYHMRFMKDVEVMKEGEKMRGQKGEVEMFIECNLVLDPHNKWERHWFLKHMHELFFMRLWKKQREAKKMKAINEAMRIQALIKQFFELEQFKPVAPEVFYPALGTK